MNTHNTLVSLSTTKKEMNKVIDNYFRTGGYENQMKILSSAIMEIINKGAEDSEESLDKEFVYTNRYIRESVYEITELQKFLIDLNDVYRRYRRNCEYLNNNTNLGETNLILSELS